VKVLAPLDALVGAYGVYLVVTALLFGWRGLAPRPRRHGGGGTAGTSARDGREGRLAPDLDRRELVLTSAIAFVGATAVVVAVVGAVLPALALGAAAACWPTAAARARARRRRQAAADAWPRLLEEVALLAGSLGSSIPQALFEVGRTSPPELQPAFAAASRQWLVSTDLAASFDVLTRELADPTADAACETLLVAHEVGGSDLPRRLAALVEDRTVDLESRRDAVARQAGARFARRFVLLVPLGMALAGLAIGDGRAAYQSPGGQLTALLGLAMVAVCWMWSGRIMQLPSEERVFGA